MSLEFSRDFSRDFSVAGWWRVVCGWARDHGVVSYRYLVCSFCLRYIILMASSDTDDTREESYDSM